MNERDRHNRSVMLQRIKTYWLVGVLQESLHGAEIIDLAMAYRPSAVQNHQLQVQSVAAGFAYGESFDQPLPLGTPIVDVYDEAGGTLLIMGEPGAGKTTTLLQLVSQLLERAELDESKPIPVVFGLASWPEGQPLGTWMVNALSNNYEVPRQLGQIWLQNGVLLPLLDGLDEVDVERREACAQAINQFRRTRPSLATAVTCRSRDYEALTTDLMLAQAVVLQPLSMDQIDDYLASVGKRLAGLRAALQTDGTLRELAESPLMLSIMTLAYYRMPENAAISLGERGMGRQMLFEVYVERMARYRDGDKLYAPSDTTRWLSWLAAEMYKHNQTLFFLEGLQPSWLKRPLQRSFVKRLQRLLGGIIGAVGVGAGLLGLLLSGWDVLVIGGLIGLVTVVITAIFGIIPPFRPIKWRQVETVEAVGWSWPWSLLGGSLGALGGMVVGGLALWLSGLLHVAENVPWMLLLPVLGAGLLVLDRALLQNDMKIRTQPGEGINHSRLNSVRVGVVTGVLTAVVLTLSLVVANFLEISFQWGELLPFLLGTAVYLGVIGGLMHGGLAVLQHRQLVKLLHQDGLVPDDYVQFLDYAAERSLLRKVGGGYMFVHALLLDYFRDLDIDV
ncbi:MAG: NACHT domain-containing protein [Chloroflexi bacterium]|nr:MAG: NACHT domain-containing protein [Chloroflexota bacterium]